MKSDYLWDGSGEPDPEVVRLERALAPARYREEVDLPVDPTAERTDQAGRDRSKPPRRAWLRRPTRLRVAALGLAVAAAAAALLLSRRDPGDADHTAGAPGPSAPPGTHGSGGPPDPSDVPGPSDPRSPSDAPDRTGSPASDRPALGVKRLAGAPVVGDSELTAAGLLRAGEWLVTDRSSRALIELVGIGEVRVGPDSRVRLVDVGPAQQRLELGRGVLHAAVVAPPRLFLVDLPSATAVDLGCEYELAVDEAGAGVLRVMTGEVSLEGHGRASLVPAGSACETRPGQGPGTPYRSRAPEQLIAALRRFDFEAGGRRALDAALDAASSADSLTLWHLIQRSAGRDRARVVARLAALAPPPPQVNLDDPATLDEGALEAWRGQLQATW